MNIRTINILLFVSFLLCYLEWGGNNSGFIFQLELDVIQNAASGESVLHPLVILPFLGQVLLIFLIFQRAPYKVLNYMSIGFLSPLVVVILLTGILSMNWKTIFSTLPFIVFAIMGVIELRRRESSTVSRQP